jgi:hypothetical protein
MPVRRSALLLAILLAAVASGGCGQSDGQSKAEKASAQACTARAGIAKEVDHLQGLTVATFTADGVRQSLQTIKADLSTIRGAGGALVDEKRDDVASANEAFTAAVRETAATVGRSVSLETGATQLKQAFDDLATIYRDTLGKLNCGT